MMLSVLMPVYNEIDTIAKAIAAIKATLPGVDKELIVVDDGSSDGTREWLVTQFGPTLREDELPVDVGHEASRANGGSFAVQVILHARNKGKGGAVRTAMRAARGAVLVVQDADLEYDPADLALLYDLIAVRKVADVVYGSRFYGRPHRSLNFHHYCGNRLISTLFNILFNQTLTDIETCYKMFTREVLDSLRLSQDDFGFEIEISAQIAKAKHWRIYEAGIQYFGRTYAEGKKITWRDGLKALWYVVKFRVVS